MTKSTVNKIISKIQFTIYSLFAFILSMGILSYAILSYGVNIAHINLPYFKAEQLYIKLDKKLILHVGKIDVTLGNDSSDATPIFKLPKFTPVINIARKNFQYLYIDELNVKDLKVTFRYTDVSDKPEDNRFTINSADINASVSYHNYEDYAHLKIDHFIHKPSKINVNGSTVYSFVDEKTYGKLIFSLSKSADVTMYAYENGDEVFFTASSNVFTDLEPIVKLFNFRHSIYKWIVPYNKASSYQLLQAKGVYNYTNTNTLLNTLYLHAQEKNLSYTFNEDLSPVKGLDADVYFTKGILDVQPHHATYNQHQIKRGGVLIDFNGKEVLLSVDLYVNEKMDKDIINIVKAYGIPLPLLQVSGKTDAHVKIFINLATSNAYATGQFFIKKSLLSIDGVIYKVQNASLRLHKSILNIDTAVMEYKNILKAKVNAQIDLKDVEGDVYFDIQKVYIPLNKNDDLSLVSKHPRVNLHFTKDTESYILPDTQWNINGIDINIKENQIFTQEKFSSVLLLNNLNLNIKDTLDLNTSGFYNLKDQYAVLDINLSRLHYQKDDINISKKSKNIGLKLTHKSEETKVSLLEKSTFFINHKALELKPIELTFKDGYLDFSNAIVSYDKQLYSYLSTHYKLGSTSIKMKAKNTVLLNHDALFIKPNFDILYHYVKNKHYLDIPKYNIHAVLNEKEELDLQIRDFKKLKEHSNVLKRYDINEGHANITYIDNNIGIDVDLLNFHPLLSKNGNNIHNYKIKGNYQNETAHLQINKKLEFIYKEKGKLTAKNIDFNIFNILSYLEQIKSDKKENELDLLIKTQQCDISLGDSNRKVVADRIDIQIKNDDIFAQLVHKNGAVLFEGNDRNFSVHAQGLNDDFMNNLFKFSKFTGGNLSFMMEGSTNELTGIVNIQDSTIEDYTVINNTLAFFNTIPSLVTFSIPGYSKDGLKAKEMYASFNKNGDVIHINEAKITSKELVITATGQTNFKKEDIEMLMQVKTDIGSSAKDIPVIGYIIFGDDSISTTVRVHGPLKDPIVESSVGKSVVVAPYNILKRAIKMPFQAFGLFNDDNKSEEE